MLIFGKYIALGPSKEITHLAPNLILDSGGRLSVPFSDAPKQATKIALGLKRLQSGSLKILTGDQAAITLSVCRGLASLPETVLTNFKLGVEMTAIDEASHS